jgi:hypothetical protein
VQASPSPVDAYWLGDEMGRPHRSILEILKLYLGKMKRVLGILVKYHTEKDLFGAGIESAFHRLK